MDIITTIQPPPFVERIQYKKCIQVNLNGKRVYQTPDGETTPSVTTILGATKDMTHLNEWKKRLPNAEYHEFDAGHYLLEDAADEVIPIIQSFLEKNAEVQT